MVSTKISTLLSQLFFGMICISATVLFCACPDRDEFVPTKNYTATIMMPDAEDKHVNDQIHIHVNFDEADGQTIENIRVIIQQVNETLDIPPLIYDMPVLSAINEAGGHAEHHDDFLLNVAPHTDWVIQAYVWEGDDVFSESTGVFSERTFHVHP